ncbi:uncharacterized protein zgc:153345 isoform X2 [Tachysurus fulvidraco]|uniref:uncharacterized protein zgc:153345 isoform X2 n=1 Tax=Tachysurus fulvidraco TaxID=1234273 RepID=UPI001FEF7A5C|nr:uncharacterized protein zgc:153345 isoform X2 [Tachysurus fulvidraco]
MPALTEERARVLAVVRALKAVGVRVRNWKSFLHSEKPPEHQETPQQQQLFAFGRDVQLLPQCHVAEVDGSVPLFLVEACEYLSQHIHTEGIFRKTGSLCRIRALRSDLEKGKRIFLPPHDALLQPCDVASVLKQFLRELPEPLIAGELQVALCHAQTLETGASERATLLLTSLLPPVHIHTLRYFCSFLRRVAQRCDENRMEVSSLALVMAPNLLPCSPQSCRLTVLTEKQLEQQAAAIRILIAHAERIGVVPSFVLDTLGAAEASDSTPPLEGALLNKRARLGVYSSLCRQRRRSVGEMFVDAFSKLKPSRTHTVPPLSLDASSGPPLSPTPLSPTTVKRKVSEDEAIGSARKRRSLHDLRADVQSIRSQSTDDLTEGPSPQEVKSSDESQRGVSETTGKVRVQRKSHRAPKQEDHRARRRRRSLRFFSVSSNSESPVLSVTPCSDSETCLSSCKKLCVNKTALFSSDSDSSLKIPLILIEEPGRVVIGSEVDDDPELLNCSFIENPDYVSGSESEESLRGRQQQDSEQVQDDDHWVLLDDGNPDVIVEYNMNRSQRQEEESLKTEGGVKVEEQETVTHNKPRKKKNISQKRSGPRRSISMPEVALDPHSDKVDEVQQEVGTNEATFYDDMWSTSVSLPLKKSGGKGKEGRELRRRRYGTFHEQQKKEKGPDSDLKKANFRLSMAERFRSFSALASFLRTPTVRLRRQGARRFSRSFSDEAVQEDQQAFLELNDELTDSEEPNEELRPEHLPSPSTPSSPSEDQTLIGTSQKSENDENQQINECVMLQMLKVENLDLDSMFEQQCHISEYAVHSDSNWDVQLDGSTPSSQRRALFTSPEDPRAFTASETEPPSVQCEASPCDSFGCLTFDGVFSISSVSEKCSLTLDLSPPTFQFRPPGSRRHYRDSPRWPSHQVRMSTFKPLPF